MTNLLRWAVGYERSGASDGPKVLALSSWKDTAVTGIGSGAGEHGGGR